MSLFDKILTHLPEVAGPLQKRLSFKEKLKWTGIILVIFFVLGLVPLFGLGQNELERFEFLAIILGASFGSIISLGVGPLVTGSIVLQLLNGSGIVKFDLTSPEGKRRFQGVQKILGAFFVIFEAFIYVFMGGLAPAPELAGSVLYSQIQLLLVFQLILGGVLIMFMDEVVSKWGFGSGISLFIAGGSKSRNFYQGAFPTGISNKSRDCNRCYPCFISKFSKRRSNHRCAYARRNSCHYCCLHPLYLRASNESGNPFVFWSSEGVWYQMAVKFLIYF